MSKKIKVFEFWWSVSRVSIILNSLKTGEIYLVSQNGPPTNILLKVRSKCYRLFRGGYYRRRSNIGKLRFFNFALTNREIIAYVSYWNKPMFPYRDTALFSHHYFFLVNNFPKIEAITFLVSVVRPTSNSNGQKIIGWFFFEKLISRVWHQRYVFWALSFWDRTRFASQLGLDVRRSNFSHLFIFWAVPWLIYILS